MEYSEENLMKLIDRASHMTGDDGGREKEDRGHEDDHDHKEDHGHKGNHDHGEEHEHKGDHDHGEDHDHKGKDGGKIGYPNCPGPGCGKGCPYKGTDECPKVAARKNVGDEEHQDDDHHKDDHHDDGHHKDGHHDDEHCKDEHHEDNHNKDDHHEDEHHHGKGSHGPMGRERVLTFLSESETISQSKLADMLQIRPQSVSELLGKLEADGYIVRTQNDQDKRETLISLTKSGKERAKEVKDMQAEHTAKVLAPLNEEEKKTLFTLLAKLTGENAEQ